MLYATPDELPPQALSPKAITSAQPSRAMDRYRVCGSFIVRSLYGWAWLKVNSRAKCNVEKRICYTFA